MSATVNAEAIYRAMMDAGEDAFKDGWEAVKTYAPAEFKKMAVQLVSIAKNVALHEADESQGYSAKTGKILFKMQRTACESVLVAVTQLTLIAVQKAINAIMKVLKDTFSGIIAAVI